MMPSALSADRTVQVLLRKGAGPGPGCGPAAAGGAIMMMTRRRAPREVLHTTTSLRAAVGMTV